MKITSKTYFSILLIIISNTLYGQPWEMIGKYYDLMCQEQVTYYYQLSCSYQELYMKCPAYIDALPKISYNDTHHSIISVSVPGVKDKCKYNNTSAQGWILPTIRGAAVKIYIECADNLCNTTKDCMYTTGGTKIPYDGSQNCPYFNNGQ